MAIIFVLMEVVTLKSARDLMLFVGHSSANAKLSIF